RRQPRRTGPRMQYREKRTSNSVIRITASANQRFLDNRIVGRAGFFQTFECLADCLAHLFRVGFVTICASWQKETIQSVFLIARNDVDMQVGYALADPVVDGDKRSPCGERLLYRGAQTPGDDEQGCRFLDRGVGQGLKMRLQDEEAMSREQGPVV